MNSTSGSHAVARELGLSVPGLHEAARSLSIATTPGGHLCFAPGDVATLVERVGRVPLIDGFTRTQVQVLTALSRHPLGLISQRAVARAAQVSPATAGKALAKLKADGLAGKLVVRLFDGQVSDRTVWKANFRSPQWSRIAPHLGRVVLPSHQSEQVEVPTRLPPRLARVFWTGDWREVNPRSDPDYVARRILQEGAHDPEALLWAAEYLPADAIHRAVRSVRCEQEASYARI
jgi:hypothetical protein